MIFILTIAVTSSLLGDVLGDVVPVADPWTPIIPVQTSRRPSSYSHSTATQHSTPVVPFLPHSSIPSTIRPISVSHKNYGQYGATQIPFSGTSISTSTPTPRVSRGSIGLSPAYTGTLISSTLSPIFSGHSTAYPAVLTSYHVQQVPYHPNPSTPAPTPLYPAEVTPGPFSSMISPFTQPSSLKSVDYSDSDEKLDSEEKGEVKPPPDKEILRLSNMLKRLKHGYPMSRYLRPPPPKQSNARDNNANPNQLTTEYPPITFPKSPPHSSVSIRSTPHPFEGLVTNQNVFTLSPTAVPYISSTRYPPFGISSTSSPGEIPPHQSLNPSVPLSSHVTIRHSHPPGVQPAVMYEALVGYGQRYSGNIPPFNPQLHIDNNIPPYHKWNGHSSLVNSSHQRLIRHPGGHITNKLSFQLKPPLFGGIPEGNIPNILWKADSRPIPHLRRNFFHAPKMEKFMSSDSKPISRREEQLVQPPGGHRKVTLSLYSASIPGDNTPVLLSTTGGSRNVTGDVTTSPTTVTSIPNTLHSAPTVRSTDVPRSTNQTLEDDGSVEEEDYEYVSDEDVPQYRPTECQETKIKLKIYQQKLKILKEMLVVQEMKLNHVLDALRASPEEQLINLSEQIKTHLNPLGVVVPKFSDFNVKDKKGKTALDLKVKPGGELVDGAGIPATFDLLKSDVRENLTEILRAAVEDLENDYNLIYDDYDAYYDDVSPLELMSLRHRKEHSAGVLKNNFRHAWDIPRSSRSPLPALVTKNVTTDILTKFGNQNDVTKNETHLQGEVNSRALPVGVDLLTLKDSFMTAFKERGSHDPESLHRDITSVTSTHKGLPFPVGKTLKKKGVANVDYPAYQAMPPVYFKCDSVDHDGYYGDPDTSCQAFHVCFKGTLKESFLCPIGTVFNQEFFMCDWWYNVDCEQTTSLYYLNSFLQFDPKTGIFTGTPMDVNLKGELNTGSLARRAIKLEPFSLVKSTKQAYETNGAEIHTELNEDI